MKVMKVRHSALYCVMLTLALGSILAVTACGSGTGTTGGSTGNGTPTVAAAATAKPKPTAVPHLTLEYCQQLMSLDEMNTLFKPPAPATTIVPTNGDTGGACNYEVAKANIPLIIYFLEWKGPDPIPQSDIDAELAQAIGTEITITVATPVTGIGHQAEYVEATGNAGKRARLLRARRTVHLRLRHLWLSCCWLPGHARPAPAVRLAGRQPPLIGHLPRWRAEGGVSDALHEALRRRFM